MIPDRLFPDVPGALGGMLERIDVAADDEDVLEVCSLLQEVASAPEERLAATLFCLNTDTEMDGVREVEGRVATVCSELDSVGMNPAALRAMLEEVLPMVPMDSPGFGLASDIADWLVESGPAQGG